MNQGQVKREWTGWTARILHEGGTHIDEYLYNSKNLSQNADMIENYHLCLNFVLFMQHAG